MKFMVLFIAAIMIQNLAFPQGSTWVQDSLAYYQKNYQAHLKAGDLEKAKDVIFKIQDKGVESLDPQFFDFYNDAIKDPQVANSAGILGNLHSGLGTLEFYRGDIKSAKNSFTSAKGFYTRDGMKKEAAGMGMNLGVMHEKLGNYDSAITNYRETIPIFESFDDAKSLGNVYENIGLTNYMLSKFNSALQNYNKTDSLLSSYLDSMNIRWVGFYMNKSSVLEELNRHDEGLALLLKGLRIAEKNEHEFLIHRLNSRLSEVYEFNGETDKQYKALLKSKSFFDKSQNKSEIANLDYKMARYQYQHGSMDSALYYAQKSFQYYEENGLSERMGMVLNMMGNMEFSKNSYEKALQFYQQSLAYLKNEKTQSYAGFLFNMGYAFHKVGNNVEALDYIEKSLAISKELNDLQAIRNSYQGLYETYHSRGDYKSAFDFLTLFHAYEDSIFNETKNRNLAELETQYETEKKDQAILNLEQEKEIQGLRAQKQQAQINRSIGGLILFFVVAGLFFRLAKIRKKHNGLLALKNKEIAKQSGERELLLKEIHHRVKNNLQIISSLLSMQTRGLQDDKVKDAMKESQSRVKTMALIHEKLYQYENLSKINMQEYMRQLSDFLTQTYRSDKDIKINIVAEEINLDMDLAIPIGLITNELLSNSLKYAFEDMEFGEIDIIFKQSEPGSYQLLVKDTGKGLDVNLDIEKTKSLGLKLVRTLTRQIDGKLKISSDKGASFQIEFKEISLAA
jgi:two-component sensor histidine kinase